jgi:hypothetical protein
LPSFVDGTVTVPTGAAATWLDTSPLVTATAGGAAADDGAALETTFVRRSPDAGAGVVGTPATGAEDGALATEVAASPKPGTVGVLSACDTAAP